jgi:phospholipid/cholesterol/gamma-HCH transport system substrate-binding protein
MPPRGRELKVGLVILTAFVVLAVAVFLIGDKKSLFSRKNHYYVEFNNVSGIKPGSPVQLNGVAIGSVEEVSLPSDPTKERIRVWITLDRKYAERIRGGVQAPVAGTMVTGSSQARIKTLGLLGDKFLEISIGSPQLPVIPDQGQIPAAQPTNVDALLSSGEDVMDNVVEISHSLSVILGRMERGEGLLGELTSDSEGSRRLRGSIVGTTEAMQRIADKVDTGQGPLGRLLNDRAMADKLATSLDRLDALLAEAQTGPGLLPGLIHDPAMKTSVQDTLARLNGVARDVQGLTADLGSSDALLPRLVKDEEYGRKVTARVQEIVDNLDDASRSLAHGEGSAAKLLNDPQIYDAVNDIIIGVNESRLLRWLIRNRQKKGIETRYQERVEGMKQEGQTPPPLDSTPAVSPTPEPTPTPTPEPTPSAPSAETPPAPEPSPSPTPPPPAARP